jgi:cation transport ATPase
MLTGDQQSVAVMIAGAAIAFSNVMVVSNALLLRQWQAPSTT